MGGEAALLARGARLRHRVPGWSRKKDAGARVAQRVGHGGAQPAGLRMRTGRGRRGGGPAFTSPHLRRAGMGGDGSSSSPPPQGDGAGVWPGVGVALRLERGLSLAVKAALLGLGLVSLWVTSAKAWPGPGRLVAPSLAMVARVSPQKG